MNMTLSPLRIARPNGAACEAAKAVADMAFANAGSLDFDGAFPEREVAELHRVGLLSASLAGPELNATLRRIGAGSLALGRLYEGHVNAIGLVQRYGREDQIARVADETRQGQLFGVWNTDDAGGLHLIRDGAGFRLQGRKILCSGAGRIPRPLITATDESGRQLMVTPRVEPERADLSSWTAQGMRASATGAVDFTGIAVAHDEVLGDDGDYERQPFFSGGAWRFCAVQQGGMETLLALLRRHLTKTGRGGDPHQAARLGDATLAVETARLWVERAADIAEGPQHQPERTIAYVNLARIAVERAGLALIELVQRSVGLQSFMRPNPIERVVRDLATYLRQPAPDRALTNAAAFVLAQEENAFDG
jgi:alkylation response protein AidB-like acyl-CoA dehydrogenase